MEVVSASEKQMIVLSVSQLPVTKMRELSTLLAAVTFQYFLSTYVDNRLLYLPGYAIILDVPFPIKKLFFC